MLRLFMLLCFPLIACGQAPVDPAKSRLDEKTNIRWYDGKLFTIEGQGWKQTDAPYDRFPAKAKEKVPEPVWGLSRHSAGIAIRFMTDAPALSARWTLTAKRLEMPHMPATGVSGLDLYVRSTKDQHWQWLGIGIPKEQSNIAAFVLPGNGQREYLLYLPLYNGVSSLELGINQKFGLTTGPDRLEHHRKPLVFWGTSITQGGCASRPGMVHTAILGRRLDRPVLNFGFSGNGKMDASVAELLAEIDAAVYVIDCLPNMDAKLIEERTATMVAILRKTRPATPILLVEDRSYANAAVLESVHNRNLSNRAALKKEFNKLIAAKAGGLYYLSGDQLLGDDGEGTVDNSHPNDLGFVRQAEVMAGAIAPLLPRK